MKNLNFRVILTVAAIAFIAAGVHLSGTTGLTQIKIVKPTPTPVKTGVGGGQDGNAKLPELIETKIVGQNLQIEGVKKENVQLQKQIAELKKQIAEMKTQSSTLDTKLNDLNAKYSSRQHKLNLNFTTLPSLGCAKCNATLPVLTYGKSVETTYPPISK